MIRRRDGFVVFVLSCAACVASLVLGCGWVVGVSGDVTLATDGGSADRTSGGDHASSDATTDGDPSADGGSNADTGFDFDAEGREDGEPDRDAARFDAARDARND